MVSHELGKWIDAGNRVHALSVTLDVPVASIYAWRRGEYLPSASYLLPLARAIGVTVEELLNGESVKASRPAA